MTKRNDEEKRFKVQQLEKQLETTARMVRAYPYKPEYQRKLNYIQNKLAQLRNK